MAKPPESLDDLMGAIADGAAVDWPALEKEGRLTEGELGAARKIARLRDSSELLLTGFERFEVIGRGAFGVVYRARDRVLGRDVALKVLEKDATLTAEQRARFLREARALAACEHENIVRIHSVEERDGHLELCLELLDGVTLEQFVRDEGPFSAVEAARVGGDLCRALAVLHARGLVHRDVKPANVMRARGGRIVLLDFGLAHATDPTTRRGAARGGTPLFMAPELLHGAKEFDARVDLYSLGVTLYWLVTTKWPYDAASPEELIEKMGREPSIPLLDRRADLPAAYVAVVERALAKDPAQRFASAGEMEAALRAVGAARVAALTRRRLVSVAVATLLLVATAMAFTAWRGRPIRAEVEVDRVVKVDGNDQLEPLTKDDAVKIGDHLAAQITLDRPAYVWGFNVDQADNFYAIFPSTWTTLKNPLPAGTSLLPGPDTKGGGDVSWQIDSAGTLENYYFFVAAEPVDEVQKMWDKCPKPNGTGGAVESSELRSMLRGGGTLRGDGSTGRFHASLAGDSKKKLSDELNELADGRKPVSGVTILRFAVTNSGH